ncbi:MAG: DNA sulfur modification protein DndB [Verrucomicrobia bacterium]|jgi:DNA sulfur modification protein DndB|nr:DNA sulfur modification protein DndB [Verrucomicrobiota bacterium]
MNGVPLLPPTAAQIDWSRKNAKHWECRSLIGGKVSKVTTDFILTTDAITLS